MSVWHKGRRNYSRHEFGWRSKAKCSISLIAMAAAGAAAFPAYAEQGDASDISGGSQTSDRGGVESIVVTAQRRTERLQDVPVSVSALPGDTLTNAGVEGMTSLGGLVPSLSVSPAAGFTTTFLRGVGSTAIGPGLEPPVAIYLDGVYYASTQSSLFEFSNIERIEVLKGPQGTLFGRNATGGLIQIITRDPDQTVHANAHLSYGNYQTVRGDAYISGPLTDNLAMDLSILAGTQGEGWGTNLYTGKDINKNDHNFTARSKMVYEPGPMTTITLAGDYTNFQNSFNGVRPPIGSLTMPALGAGEFPGPWNENANINPRKKNYNYGGSAKIEQDLGFATLSNLAAYRYSNTDFRLDLDYTPTAHLDAPQQIDIEKQVSNELNLSSNGSGPFTWVAGFFFFHAKGSYDPSHVEFNNPATDPFNVPPMPIHISTLLAYGFQNTTSWAGYAQASYEFLPATNLTFGSRYSWEKRTISGYTEAYNTDGTSAGTLGPAVSGELTFNKPTFRVALDHRFSPKVMAYASYNTGFKSGGFNTQSVSDPSFLPENLKAYEVGLKTELLNSRLLFNADAFHYEYSNIQVQKVGLTTTGIINGAAARVWGAEFDFHAAITDNFTLSGSGTYLDAKFKDFQDAPFGPPEGTFAPVTPGDASGNYIAKSPKFSSSLYGDYRFDLPKGSELHLNGLVEYNNGYYLEADNITKQTQFARVNATLKWISPNGLYSISVWGRNLTDQAILSYESTLADGSRNGSYDAPRTFGVTLGYDYN